MIHQGEAGDTEEGDLQADGVLYCQENSEFPEGALEDIHSTEGCGGSHQGGGMGSLGDGLVYGGEGPLQANHGMEAMGGVLLKKDRGQV